MSAALFPALPANHNALLFLFWLSLCNYHYYFDPCALLLLVLLLEVRLRSDEDLAVG